MINNPDTQNIPDSKWWPSPPLKTDFSEIATDSRRVFKDQDVLFFCLTGPRHDGHRFQGEAHQKKVRHFVVEYLPESPLPDTHYLLVKDSTLALQQLAAGYRQQFSFPFIAITGSNGKTIIKEWCYTLLRDHFNIVRSPRSYNSQIGVPLSLLLAKSHHNLAILEAGISRMGEMQRLADAILPDMGIFTHLGAAHDEGFPDRPTKLQEKLKLFARVRLLLAPQSWVVAYPAYFEPFKDRLKTWSLSQEADLRVVNTKSTQQGMDVTYQYRGESHTYQLPFTDQASLENSLAALLLTLEMGLSPEVINPLMITLPALSMRLERREGQHGNLILNDFYNADLDGLQTALSFYKQQKSPHHQGWLILSDLDETGISQDELAEKIGALLQATSYDRITLIGIPPPKLLTFIPEHIRLDIFPDTDQFLANTDLHSLHQTTILLKGSRRFAFEKISHKLIKFTHRTRMEINLDHLSYNLNIFAKQLPSNTKIMVMVKASAYGGGSREIGQWLAYHKVDYLGVAYPDEGIELRQAGVALPIMVMNTDQNAFPLLNIHGLEPVIHSLHQLRALRRFLEPSDTLLRIHIKLETGMHRLGFEGFEIEEMLRLIQDSRQLQVASVFTHLGASEDPAQDTRTRNQINLFTKYSNLIQANLGYTPLRHVLNSCGILRHPAYAMDMVRLGIGLYGLTECPGTLEKPKSAIAMKTTISRIQRVPAGEGIGYGFKNPSTQDRRIATLAIGYADGLLRLAGEGRFSVMIEGKAAPTVGSICMDMCMVDISDIPEATEKSEVIIFDENRPIRVLSEVLQTIPYEVLTNISSRIPRIYFNE